MLQSMGCKESDMSEQLSLLRVWVQSLNGELGFGKQCNAAENKKELGDQNGELSVQFSCSVVSDSL